MPTTDVLDRIVGQAVHDHFCAVPCELETYRFADSRSAAGYDRNPVFQLLVHTDFPSLNPQHEIARGDGIGASGWHDITILPSRSPGMNARSRAHDDFCLHIEVGPMEYYVDRGRGAGVPQWQNAFAVMSWEPWLDFDPVGDASRVTAPTLVVHSDGCVMPDHARKVHDNLKGERSLHWARGNHFEFYDGPGKVREAADVAAEHFRKHLI